MTLKKLIRRLHLWLGLTSGTLVIVISLTGCIYAFQEEIKNTIEQYRFVEPSEEAFLPPSKLAAIAKETLPEKHLHAIEYKGRLNAAEAIFWNPSPRDYHKVYLNPYSGEVLKIKDVEKDFFRIVLMGHFYLWLPPDIGQPLVAGATLVFIIILISGLVLWWPKNKKASKQRFSIKWDSGMKRKIFDLHNVLGFYASFIVLILALTGLVWGFEWFKKSVYYIAGGDKELEYVAPQSSIDDSIYLAYNSAIDKVWQYMQLEYPNAASIEIHIPETEHSSIEANANLQEGTFWKTDFRYFDRYSLKELSPNNIYGRLEDSGFADKLLRMNYDIHVGAILGLPGKILAFFASLIFASLPVTGFIIWWGKRKKKRKEPDNKKRTLINSSSIKYENYIWSEHNQLKNKPKKSPINRKPILK